MNYINEKEFKISGILNWHKKGYTGKGVRIANIEKCNIDAWYLKDMVNDPFSNAKQEKENSHGNQTLNMISQVSPDAKFYTLPRGGRYTNDKAEGNLIDKTIPFIISENICLVNASFGGVNNKPLNEAILKAQKHGATFICSAGNSGDRGASPYAKSGVWMAVGAVVLTAREEIKLTTYSSVDEAVDFVQFSEILVNDVRDGHTDRLIHRGGTSFSSPLLTGMLALVQQFFKEKSGQYLKQDKLYQFMMDNSVDLGDVGKDTKYGHGLFVLPEPDAIDVEKYLLRDRPTPTPEEPIEENPPIHNNLQEIMSESDYTLFTNYKNIYDGAKKDNNKVAMDYAKQSALALLNKYGIEDNYFNDDEPPTIPEEPTPEPEPPIEEPELPTPDPPIENPNNKIYKVFIDPGHGGKDPGAIGNGLQEKDIVLPMSLKVGKILKKHNIEVIYSRTTDTYMSLADRVTKANQANVDVFVSIHVNAYSNPTANGIETFSYPGSTKNSDQLAQAIQDELVKAKLFKSDRGTKTENFYVLRETKMTAALTELGFITNAEDTQILRTREDKISEAVAKGILNYLGIKCTNGMPILSKATVFVTQMQEWAKKKNAHQTFINLAPTFYAISSNTSVNPAVTYAQSAKETGYMKFGGVLDASYFNPCGMKKTSGGGDKDPSAHQRFLNWEEGIQAQVDHLALYAGAGGYPKANTPDPRHFPYLHGTATTVESLGGKWAPSLEYGNSIVRMVKEVENTVVEVEPEPTPKPIEQIELTDIKIKLHDKDLTVKGIYNDGINYIPVRFLEQLGYDISWNDGVIEIDYKI